MPKITCIYCLKEKEKREFNKEHVIAKSFGTYTNAAVLSRFEVCKECNTFFSEKMESVINIDSLETVERMRFGKPMGDNTRLKSQRTKVQIVSGIFEGLEVIPTVNNNLIGRIFFLCHNVIGIRKEQEEIKYDFYTIENLPCASDGRSQFVNSHQYGVLILGYDHNQVREALKEKGWPETIAIYDSDVAQQLLDSEGKIKLTTTDINDSIKRRFAAKNVFNFLCYNKGKDFVLSKQFDLIRNYIRYGVYDRELDFTFNMAPDKTMDLPNEHSHCVGYMWCPDNGAYWTLYGIVTWYGRFTYHFKLCTTNFLVSRLTDNILPSTEVIYCDNNMHQQIIDKKGVYVYRNSSGLLALPFPYKIKWGADSL